MAVETSAVPPKLPPLRVAQTTRPLTGLTTSTATASSSATRSRPWPVNNPTNSRPLTTQHPNHSFFLDRMPSNDSSSLVSLLATHNVLYALAAYLEWADFYALFTTSKAVRDLFKQPRLRDAILARYVPGYAHCLRLSNAANVQHVPVSFHDLDLLLVCQRVPLHRYPMHALRTMSSILPTIEDDEMSSKLIALAQAHSRFVLLLQSLVHSSDYPLAHEPALDPSSSSSSSSSFSSNLLSPTSRLQPLRELRFPAPLAYATDHNLPQPAPAPFILASGPNNTTGPAASPGTFPTKKKPKRAHRHHHQHSRSVPTTDTEFSSNAALPLTRNPTAKLIKSQPSANSLSALSISNGRAATRSRRVSIFGKSPSRSPPPPEEPRTLKEYGSTWRRSMMFNNQSSFAASHYDSGAYSADEFGGSSGSLRRPDRRFLYPRNSSDSSLGSKAGFHDSHQYKRRSHNTFGYSPSPSPYPSMPAPLRFTSPHDLSFATSRMRAPVLRVFVPCSRMEDGDDALLACENQLHESGLWALLSTGDVVCNLGFVPPGPEDVSDADDLPLPSGNGGFGRSRSARSQPSSTSSASHHSPSSSPCPRPIPIPPSSSSSSAYPNSPSPMSSSSSSSSNARKWLIFNGQILLPYTPPGDILPLTNPLTLPTPFYYAHIMPPGSTSTFFRIGQSFADMVGEEVDMDMPNVKGQLVQTSARVPSPQSFAGWVMVKKFAWTVTVPVRKVPVPVAAQSGISPMGGGWYGEWVLEGDGTREGKRFLLDCLKARGMPGGRPRTWEVVREKSGGGRIWLKLMPL